MQKIGLIPPSFVTKNEEKRTTKVKLAIPESQANANDLGINDQIGSLLSLSSNMKSNKSKKSIAIRETNRMKLVQQDQSFINDPIAAVTLHLQLMAQKRSDSKT